MIVTFSSEGLKNITVFAALKNEIERKSSNQVYDFKPLALGLHSLCKATSNERSWPEIRSLIIEAFEAGDTDEEPPLICLTAAVPTEIKLTDSGFKYFSTVLEQFFDPDFLFGLEEYLRKYNLNERQTYDAVRGSSTTALVDWLEDYTHPKEGYDRDRCAHVTHMIELELQRRKEESSHA